MVKKILLLKTTNATSGFYVCKLIISVGKTGLKKNEKISEVGIHPKLMIKYSLRNLLRNYW